jgi:hypothetical protein
LALPFNISPALAKKVAHLSKDYSEHLSPPATWFFHLPRVLSAVGDADQAGGFMYIGTVGVIPELLELDGLRTKSQEFRDGVSQLIAMFIGIGLMAYPPNSFKLANNSIISWE